jgi:molecular chaperone DnaK (HSP70)
MRHRVVGIDLGTTYSAVAVYDPDMLEAEVLCNREDGGEAATTPSVAALDRATGQVLIGKAAKRCLASDPQSVVIEVKREMGATDGDPPEPRRVHFADRQVLPQQISALVLMKMKEVAEAEIGEEIRDAVITVPAYFQEHQRAATKQAALLAGLYPRRLIPEPTAAAACYGVDRFQETRRAYLVYDLGGGTFDVSIIEVEGEDVIVVATSGDHHLGGGDFDDRLTEWAVDELDRHYGIRVSTDPTARSKIKYHIEHAKMQLSSFQRTELRLPDLRPEDPPVLELTREVLEQRIEPDLERSLRSVRDAIQQAEERGLRQEQLDGVLLVGGSTKIPAVKRKLVDYFERGDGFVKADLNPAAVVARGAAMVAARLEPTPPPFEIARAKDVMEQDAGTDADADIDAPVRVRPIAEHSLGVALEDGTCRRLIERGTPIPASSTQRDFTNSAPGPVTCQVYQGEQPLWRDNTWIGELRLVGIDETKPRHYHRFDLTYSLDQNGLLSVRAVYNQTGKSWEAQIAHQRGMRDEEALTLMHRELQELYRPQPPWEPPPA